MFHEMSLAFSDIFGKALKVSYIVYLHCYITKNKEKYKKIYLYL